MRTNLRILKAIGTIYNHCSVIMIKGVSTDPNWGSICSCHMSGPTKTPFSLAFDSRLNLVHKGLNAAPFLTLSLLNYFSIS